jgi:hypothetical protein
VKSHSKCMGLLVLAISLWMSTSACAQTSSKTESRQTAKAPAAMTLEDVMRLAKAGVSDEIILEQIRSRRPVFDLTVDQLVALKSAGASDAVIREIMKPRAPDVYPPEAASTAPFASNR